MPEDNHFIRNTAAISAVELFWGMGLPVVIESTFLQLFLKNLGANSFLIGLIPTLFFIGISFFSLFSGLLTGHLRRKKKAVLTLHIIASMPILVFGIILNVFGFANNTLKFFFILYTLFSIGIGLLLPAWQNYITGIYSDKKILSGHSFMWIAQSLGKFIGGFIILKVVSKYSFSSRGSALIFTLVGFLFIAGSLFFLFTKELPEGEEVPSEEQDVSGKHKFSKDFKNALHNRNFLLLLASDLELFSLITILSFYANYAVTYCGIEAGTAAGGFVILNYLGMIGINVLYGMSPSFKLKHKYITGKFISLTAALSLWFFSGIWAFFVVSFLMGMSRGARSLVYMPTIKKISGVEDSTNFFGIAPLLTMPMSTGIPLLSGAFLDKFSYLGSDSYRYLFLALAVLITAGILLLKKTEFPV